MWRLERRSFPLVEHRHEGFLWDFHGADGLHALLALLLLVEELALAGDVAAVALGGDVLSEGLDGLAGDDLAADGGLHRNFELVAGDLLAELAHEDAAAVFGLVAV